MKAYYWVGLIEGVVMSANSNCPIMKPRGKLHYMGWTESIGWPKLMNTGRVLHKSKTLSKDKRNQRKRYKNLHLNA